MAQMPSLATLINQMKALPEDTEVHRITRDEREKADAIGLNYTVYSGSPVITIELHLPPYTRTHEYQ